MHTPPVILTIAGFDPSAGAGVLADLKTIHACGGYACAVITAQTVQNTCGVKDLWLEPIEGVIAQIRTLRQDFSLAAVKIGMLGTDAMAQAILECLNDFQGPVVIDPVLKSSSGQTLMEKGRAFNALLQRATLITPNLLEGEKLLGHPLPADQLATALSQRFHTAVLLKGGHGQGETLTDYLATPDSTLRHWSHPRVSTRNTHGTGCVLSSAIATALAQGKTLPQACEQGITRLQQWLRRSLWQLGHGAGPIHLTR